MSIMSTALRRPPRLTGPSVPRALRVLSGLLALAIGVPAAAGRQLDATPRPTHQIPRTDAAVRVDGALDEPAWATAWHYELGFEVDPGENTPAPVRTEVLVMHGEKHLYVGFRSHDPDPRQIRAHLSDRDQAWADDWVGVVLDTFNDERRDYLLVINPLGVQMDNIEAWPNGQTAWDAIWDAAARVTEWGWSAEFEIPFSSLRFQRSDRPQVWGFDAVRGYPRTTFKQMGAFPRDRNNNCYLCQALKIEGFEGVSPGLNLELVPTLIGSRTDTRADVPGGPMENGDTEVEAGATVRWGFTPNLTLSAAVNPDFSQVEADARQLDVNRPFAIFYSEKRPFFMEGADFFTTPFDAVYTRMVRDPDWGAKVTGKEGAHTIGAYLVQDAVTNLVFPGSQGSFTTTLEESSKAGVARYKLDLGNRYTLGVLATGREADGYSNGVAGADVELRLSDRDRIVAQVLASSTEYPAALAQEFDQPTGSLDDWAKWLAYYHDTRTWSSWLTYADVGSDFRADMGFMPRVDFRHTEGGAQYLWTGRKDDWYSRLWLIGKVSMLEDQDGNLLENETAVRFNVEGPLQSHAYVRPSFTRQGYEGEEFDLGEVELHVCMKPNGHSHLWLNATVGDNIDYTEAREGNRVLVQPGFWYRFGPHLRLELSYTGERMDLDEDWLYEAQIAQLTAAWQFNARAFVRAIVQYVDSRYNVEQYREPPEAKSELLFTQFLFSYKLNPQTVLFAGYSDTSQGTDAYSLTRANRTVFAKIGYAFVF
ncbi:MAG: DUF5916 domain-containing protein [Acidobacteriota bacterium]